MTGLGVIGLDVFVQPLRLAALLAVPLVILLLRWLDGRASRRRVADLGRAAERFDRPVRRIQIGSAFSALGLTACIVAAADPRFGAPVVPLQERGIDLVLCLDLSRSMAAQDARPSRLVAARTELEALVERASNDRIGLVAFAGDARLVAAPTTDSRALLESLRALGTDADLMGGTDLGAALEMAGDALRSKLGGEGSAQASGSRGSRPAAIVLVTDGEDHGGRGRAVAGRLAELGVPVHVIGVGSERGAKIPTFDGAGFVTDRSGAEVVTALDRASLDELVSAAAGGSSLRLVGTEAGSGESGSGAPGGGEPGAAGRALANGPLAAMVRADLGQRERRERPLRFQWFLGTGLACFVLTGMLGASTRPGRRPSGGVR